MANARMPDIRNEAHEMFKRQLQEWFSLIDRILDVHRANFVFRKATPKELDQHKMALRESIREARFMLALIADPDFNEADLVSRLQVRIQQLQDAYNTFHDTTISDDRAEQMLRQVFPE